MIPQISYNVLIDRFRAFAEAHFLIKGFSHGDLSNIDIEKEVQFPWMHVLPVEVEPRAGTRLYSFVIIFADLPRDKETPAEYQRECISDCIKLAEDLLAEVQNGQIVFGPFVELDGGASIEVFINEFSHTLVGVNLQLTLSVPWDWSACDIPADFTIGGSGSGGEGVAVGITLQTNGVNNGLQSLLNLQQGTNVTIVDNGNGTVTINSTGGGGGGGTVTSVALTVPSAFAVSGSPITGAGTLAITGAGTSGDYIDGTGALQTFPSIPTAQGLQDVITTDPVLTTDNTIDCATFGLTIDGTSNFTVNSTSKVDINVSSDAALGIDSNSISIGKVTGTTQTQVLTDTTKAAISASESASANETSLTLFPNSARLKTPNVNDATATVGQVLTLSNAGTGEVEFTTAGVGTVTSVGLTMPSAFTVAGSPVTTAGTLAVTGAGLASQYVRGDGQLATTPTALPPNGAASGDLQGSYPNPTVHRIHSYDMQSGLPADGETWVVVPTPFGTQPVEWRHQKLNVTQLGDTTIVGQNLAKLPNPSAVRYLRINADNTVAALTLAELKTDLSVGSDISVVLGANLVNVGTTFEDITGLSFAVTAGKTYKWRATISFGIPTGTYFFSTNGPSASVLTSRFTIATGLTTNGVSNQGLYNTGTNVTGSSSGLATADGIVTVTSSGTFTLRFRCSVAGNLTIRAGSVLEYSEVL